MKTKDGSANKRSKGTNSKKCGYPFTLKGKVLGSKDEWMLLVACGVHNHPPADHLEGHSFVARLTEDEKTLLVDISKSMVRPKEILTLKKKIAKCQHNQNNLQCTSEAKGCREGRQESDAAIVCNVNSA